MKLVEFVYTKADNTTSNRAVIEMLAPNKCFEGIDISQINQDQLAEFVTEFRALKNEQHNATMLLLAKHDLKHNYRRFIPEQMTNVTVEHI